MRDIRIGAAQFEARDADKSYNLSRIEALTRRAVDAGAEIVSFHECCIPGYTFLQTLSRSRIAELAEPVPGGPSTRRLTEIAMEYDVAVLAGLVEIESDSLYNTYVAVGPDGFIAKHRKLHAFISRFIVSGDAFTVFDLCGCRVGILICYDNNLPENVRLTTMMGAEVVFMPHVTCGLPSAMPGRGVIDRALWENRHRDPVSLRQEFNGPKGRGWLMRWLPARAYENGIYAVYTNPIGIDHDTVKNGNAMILGPVRRDRDRVRCARGRRGGGIAHPREDTGLFRVPLSSRAPSRPLRETDGTPAARYAGGHESGVEADGTR